NKHGQTALHQAAYYANADVCRLLLEHGAHVDDADNDGNTPLHLTANLDTVHLLLQYPVADGSNAAALRCRTRNKKGQTALHQAAYRGSVEACRFLLEHGALVDEEDNDGKTPLQVA
ncbi:ankyrin, partial [Peniophora sp. CONT]